MLNDDHPVPAGRRQSWWNEETRLTVDPKQLITGSTATGVIDMQNAFPKIGTTKYILRIIRTEEERRNGWNSAGPFVVRSTSRKAAAAYARRTWVAYIRKSPLEIQNCNGFEVGKYEPV